MTQDTAQDSGFADLARRIKRWGAELGFGAVGISGIDMAEPSRRLRRWLELQRHGEMAYMQLREAVRADPQALLAGAQRAICVRMDYLPAAAGADWVDVEWRRLGDPQAASVSIYARGRDYHKVVRHRLASLAQKVSAEAVAAGLRPCTDSAPVFEVELGRRSGLGWRGKHTLLLSREAGSMFFLGEILTDLPLPVDGPVTDHCGSCERCIDACPTGAIVAPYELDARRCISYLTIELAGPIPETLRPLIGNRVYGCDDCQLACPWNRYAQRSPLPDFEARNGLDAPALAELFAWEAGEFAQRHAGSAILRIGHERWLRNLAVALGNAAPSEAARAALEARAGHPSALVREHVAWALARHNAAGDRKSGAA